MSKEKPQPDPNALKQRSFLDETGKVDQGLVTEIRVQNIQSQIKPLSEEEKARLEAIDDEIAERSKGHAP